MFGIIHNFFYDTRTFNKTWKVMRHIPVWIILTRSACNYGGHPLSISISQSFILWFEKICLILFFSLEVVMCHMQSSNCRLGLNLSAKLCESMRVQIWRASNFGSSEGIRLGHGVIWICEIISHFINIIIY